MTLPAGLRLEPVDVRRITDEQAEAYTRFSNVMLQERQPDDPPILASQLASQLRGIPEFIDVKAWAVYDGERLVADGHVGLLRLDHNRHVADCEVSVLPEYRGRGLGRALFELVVSAAAEDGRRLLIVGTNDRVPAGAAVLARVGAEAGLESHVNQLDLRELDSALLDTWIARAAERAGDYELLTWEGRTPEEHLVAFTEVHKVMNSAPRGSLDVEDWEVTPEQARAFEEQFVASGRQRSVVVVRHRDSGRFVGFSELSWHPERPTIVSQGGTGVRPDARGLGLGRWLKAANLRRLRELSPEARFVRTTNADVNAAMLSINHALGFRPYFAVTQWQVPVERARDYLSGVLAASS